MSDYSFHLGQPKITLGKRIILSGSTELVAAPGAGKKLNITKVFGDVKTIAATQLIQVGEANCTATDNVSLEMTSTGPQSSWYDWNAHAAANTALNCRVSNGPVPDVWVKVEYVVISV